MHKLIIVLCIASFNLYANHCTSIGVVSKSGRFLQLNNDNLKIEAVGDLRWLGIHDINEFSRNSTVNNPLAHIDRHNEMEAQYNGRYGAYVRLPSLTSFDNQFKLHFIYTPSEQTFLPITNSSYLATMKKVKNQTNIAIINANNKNNFYTTNVMQDYKTTACFVDDKFIFADTRTINTFDKNKKSQVKQHVLSNETNLFTQAQSGCTVLYRKVGERNTPNSDYYLIDLESNRIINQFRTVSYSKSFIYNNGQDVLLQKLNANVLNDDLSSVSLTASNEFITVNLERKYQFKVKKGVGTGQKIICANTTPKLLLSKNNEVSLLKLKTTNVIATQYVPFKYFSLL